MKRIRIFSMAAALLVSVVATTGLTSANQNGGANGAVAVVAQVENVLNNANVLNDSQVGLVNVNHSLNNVRALNNVLNNSPILNNFLNNSPILSGNTITVQNISVLDGAQISLLDQALQNANIAIGQVIGVAVLSGGQIIAFV
jgi:hypothetical protein